MPRGIADALSTGPTTSSRSASCCHRRSRGSVLAVVGRPEGKPALSLPCGRPGTEVTLMHADALPQLDEHTTVIAADDDRVWEALLQVVDAAGSRAGAAILLWILGCDDRTASGPRPLEQGSTTPGFRVAVAAPRRELILAGRHRFASYELVFHIDRRDLCETQLRAVSRATFPSVFGWVYGRLLISTGMHVRAVRSLLSAVQRRAERSTSCSDPAVTGAAADPSEWVFERERISP